MLVEQFFWSKIKNKKLNYKYYCVTFLSVLEEIDTNSRNVDCNKHTFHTFAQAAWDLLGQFDHISWMTKWPTYLVVLTKNYPLFTVEAV